MPRERSARLNLLKLCVGAESIGDLAAWWASGRGDIAGPDGKATPAHVTRQRPKRADEILAGGSLYWVVRGRIAVRQPILAFGNGTNSKGRTGCAIFLGSQLIMTRPRPHRPFQGWRYLEAADAPADIGPYEGEGEGSESLKGELLELGLL